MGTTWCDFFVWFLSLYISRGGWPDTAGAPEFFRFLEVIVRTLILVTYVTTQTRKTECKKRERNPFYRYFHSFFDAGSPSSFPIYGVKFKRKEREKVFSQSTHRSREQRLATLTRLRARHLLSLPVFDHCFRFFASSRKGESSSPLFFQMGIKRLFCVRASREWKRVFLPRSVTGF